jgi:hypothetical protein
MAPDPYSLSPSLPEAYFIPVSCFLTFNIFDWLGRSLTAVFMWVSATGPIWEGFVQLRHR